MSRTVVGVFDDRVEAESARQDLIAAGLRSEQVNITASPQSGQERPADHSWWDNVKDAFGFGSEEEGYAYREAARHGGVIVSVNTADENANDVAEILSHHGPIDLEKRVEEWRARESAPTAEEQRIPVIEEELRVGKRLISKGGVRIHSHVTERPVQENVELREEHVDVERQRVDRPVAPGDRAFEERTIEATESVEEPVASKEARVKEEVVLKKETEQRTEQVKDTVRRTDVDVERTDEKDRDI